MVVEGREVRNLSGIARDKMQLQKGRFDDRTGRVVR